MKLVSSILLSSLLGMVSSQAATISWSTAPFLVDNTSPRYGNFLITGQFATTGTFIFAENAGGDATSFDGINFGAGNVGSSIIFGNEFGLQNFFNEGTASVAATGTYGGIGARTVALTGLTSGHVYRIQALVYDGRGAGQDGSGTSPGRTVSFDGATPVQYANGVHNSTYGDGLLATGSFTANATTQNFTIEAFLSAANGGGSIGGQLNAITVFQTAVPEPSVALLGGLGLLALLRRRRN